MPGLGEPGSPCPQVAQASLYPVLSGILTAG